MKRTTTSGDDRFSFSRPEAAELDVLESFAPDPRGARIRTGFGPATLSRGERDRPADDAAAKFLRALLRSSSSKPGPITAPEWDRIQGELTPAGVFSGPLPP